MSGGNDAGLGWAVRTLDTVRDDGVVAGGAVDAIARSGPAGGISEEDQQP